MSRYRLSALAELDLADIADYTTDVWGAKQAELYLDSLVECFDRVSILRQSRRLSVAGPSKGPDRNR
ncbi:MAG: type II toxin-antitoxin system RelE/ParE family toxin [Acidobacteriaceae bacterium]